MTVPEGRRVTARTGPEQGENPLWRFSVRVLIAVAMAAAVFLLWRIRSTALMGFGAVVVAVLVLALAELVRRVVPLGRRWAVTVAVILLVGIALGLFLAMGSQVRSQFSELWDRLPEGVRQVEEQIGLPLIEDDGAQAPSGEATATPPGSAPGGTPDQGARPTQVGAGAIGSIPAWVWESVGSYGITLLNVVVGTILVVIAGVFLAADPGTYRRGAVMLFPVRQHQRVEETMRYMGRALHHWLVGMLISMAMVAVLVGLGTWLIGLPAPLALALFAGLIEIVPIVGPIIGAVPALLLAIPEGGTAVLWTVLLFVGIQQIESNMITPLVQERMVKIPPALFVLAVVGFGTVFGFLGVVFAAPMAVVSYVAVQKLWIRDALHEPTHVTGEEDSRD